MFLSLLKILKTTLVIGLLLPVFDDANAFAQQPGSSARLEVPHVTLLASPTSVAPGRRVRLVAHLSSGYPNIRFKFAFGDGAESAWQTSTVATHTYQAPGNYLPYVDIGTATNAGVTRLGGSPRARIHVIQTSLGQPQVSPATIGTARPATFDEGSSNNRTGRARVVSTATATGRSTIAGVRGRRSRRVSSEETATKTPAAKADSSPSRASTSGASSPTPRSSSPSTTPSAALSTSPYSSDTAQSVVTSEQAGGDWWKYLVLALPLALVAFVLGKKYLVGRPTIRTFPDHGTANVTDASGLVVDSRVERPNVLHGEHIVSSDDVSLVKNVRREDV